MSVLVGEMVLLLLSLLNVLELLVEFSFEHSQFLVMLLTHHHLLVLEPLAPLTPLLLLPCVLVHGIGARVLEIVELVAIHPVDGVVVGAGQVVRDGDVPLLQLFVRVPIGLVLWAVVHLCKFEINYNFPRQAALMKRGQPNKAGHVADFFTFWRHGKQVWASDAKSPVRMICPHPPQARVLV